MRAHVRRSSFMTLLADKQKVWGFGFAPEVRSRRVIGLTIVSLSSTVSKAFIGQ